MERNLKCMYCAEMGITNTDVFIEIVDVELGHGWICKECFIESEKEKENFLKAELQSIKERNRALEELEVFRVEELAKLDDLKVENTKLKKQLQAKEQECEELKKIIDEAKNSKLDLNSFLVGEAIQNEYEQQLDQLKADRKEALKQLEFVRTLNTVKEAEIRKLSKTLTEIKEIAENGKRFAERYMITGEQKANVLTYANAVLQKISEVLND